MLFESTRTFSLTPRPRSFAGLMEMYEVNYIRLRQLCPDMHQIDIASSCVPGALDLHLRVLERSKYTTTLLLTYHFPVDRGWKASPNLKVRVYHDARQAEVLSFTCRRRGAEVTSDDVDADSELVCKWRLNRFLYKWLGFCRHQGHLLSNEPDTAWQGPELTPDSALIEAET